MTITTRQLSGTGVTAKNSPLTHAELDQNFIDLAQGNSVWVNNHTANGVHTNLLVSGTSNTGNLIVTKTTTLANLTVSGTSNTVSLNVSGNTQLQNLIVTGTVILTSASGAKFELIVSNTGILEVSTI